MFFSKRNTPLPSGRHRLATAVTGLSWLPRRRQAALGAVLALVAATTVGSLAASGEARLPNPRSAGVPAGLSLTTHTGDLVLTSAASISKIRITGSLYLASSNINVSDVQVDGGIFVNRTPNGGYNKPVPVNITLTRVTGSNLYSLGFDRLTLDAVKLANTSGGPHAQLTNFDDRGTKYTATNLTIKNSWFYGITPGATGSLENLQLNGVQGAVIDNNEFSAIAPTPDTRARVSANVVLGSASYGQFNENITFTRNKLHGGGYFQLYFNADGTNTVSNNQFFGDGKLFTGVQYPPNLYAAWQVPAGGYVKFVQGANSLNGKPLSLPGGLPSSSNDQASSGSRSATATRPATPSSSAAASSSAASTSAGASTSATPKPTTGSSSAAILPPTKAPDASTPTTSRATTAAPNGANIPQTNPNSAGWIRGSSLGVAGGNVSLATNGQTYSNMRINGSLYISGSNVTVSNVDVAGVVYINRTPSGGYVSPVPSNITLKNVSATGVFTIGFNGLTMDAVELHDAQDAPHAQLYCYDDSRTGVRYPATNLTMVNSWVHGFLPSTTSAHVENLHIGCVDGAMISNNRFEMIAPNSQTLMNNFTANITLDAMLYGAFNNNIIFKNNQVIGGSYYQIYFNAGGWRNEVSGNSFISTGNPIFAGIQYPPSAYNSSQVPPGGYVRFVDVGNTLNGGPAKLPGGL